MLENILKIEEGWKAREICELMKFAAARSAMEALGK